MDFSVKNPFVLHFKLLHHLSSALPPSLMLGKSLGGFSVVCCWPWPVSPSLLCFCRHADPRPSSSSSRKVSGNPSCLTQDELRA
ncbi:hypothetical protein V6N13_123921 [Hibiscus sabdariffa]|uniref:Uncharacterized protein n=1 Tax=Hibiscus sabdariffa TaxID=183260 RepID=A0ABR2QV98_9ROSI